MERPKGPRSDIRNCVLLTSSPHVDHVLPLQIIVVMISFISSTLMFPILASIVTTTLISMDSLREEYQRQVDSWDQYMAHRRLPLELRSRIRAAMDYRWRTRRAVNEVKCAACSVLHQP